MSKRVKISISILLIICFVSILSLVFSQGVFVKSNFNVIFFDKEIENYIDASKDLTAKKSALWDQNMQKPFDKIVSKYVPQDEQEKASSSLFKEHFTSPETLKLYLDYSKDKKIRDALQRSYEKSMDLLGKEESEPLYVTIIPYRGMTYGVTSASNFIVLYVNYLIPEEKLLEEVGGTFAHEYAHVVSLEFASKEGSWSKTYPNTFLAQMILEGKACVFAKLVVGENYQQPMVPNEPVNQFEYYEDILNKEFTETSFFNYEVDGKSFLRTDCYYYGMESIQNYMDKHKVTNPADWMYLKPSELYEEN